jgi:hypothetical protein
MQSPRNWLPLTELGEFGAVALSGGLRRPATVRRPFGT